MGQQQSSNQVLRAYPNADHPPTPQRLQPSVIGPHSYQHNNGYTIPAESKNSTGNFVQAKRLAVEPTTVHRGLQNTAGENNCFLNVTIQALWHVGQFRVELSKCLSSVSQQSSEYGDTIMSAVSNLFVQYEFADMSTLPPTELRQMLHKLTDKFDLGSIADSNEALDAILSRIHEEASPRCPGPPKCLAHRVFGGCVMEQVQCRVCQATGEPELKDECMHLIYVSELLEAARSDVTSSIPFGNLLRSCMCLTSSRCPALLPSNAPQSTQLNTRSPARPTCAVDSATMKAYVLEPSLALALPLVWSQGRETAEVINELLSIVSYSILASELFYVFGDFITPTSTTGASSKTDGCSNDSSDGQGCGQRHSYVFRGMVCYYGKHYVSIFQEYSPGEPRFLLFDDSRIRCLGNWAEVKAECGRSLYQPVLLLYELEGSYESVDNNFSAQENNFSAQEKAFSSLPIISEYKHDQKPDGKHDIKTDDKVDAKEVGSCKHSLLDLNVNMDTGSVDDASASSAASAVFSPYRSRTMSTDFTHSYAELDRQVRRLHSSHSRRSLDIDQPTDAMSPSVDADTKAGAETHLTDAMKAQVETRADPTLATTTSISSVSSHHALDASSAKIIHTTPTLVVASNWNSSAVSIQRIRECKLKGAVMDVSIGSQEPRRLVGGSLLGGSHRPNLLGLELCRDEESRILVTGLYRHPLTHAVLPAEESGQISLMDQLLAINGRPLAGKTTQQVNEMLTSSRLPVRLTIRSASKMNLVCKCPYCESDIIVSHDKWKLFDEGPLSSANLECNVCYISCLLDKSLTSRNKSVGGFDQSIEMSL